MTATVPETERFDPVAMQRLLDGSYAELRDQIREVLTRPEFAPVIALPTDEYRRRVLEMGE